MNILDCIKKCFASENNSEQTKSKQINTSNEPIEKQNGSDQISIDDFIKLDLRVGKIEEATKVEGSDKLIKCTVNFGDFGSRTIVSGIAQFRNPEDIVGKKYLYIVNLEPRKIFGIESQGMLVALSDGENFAMLTPDAEIKEGTKAS